MNSHRVSLTLRLYSMLVVGRIAPIIIIAPRPYVVLLLSVSIQICACKVKSFIRIIAISTLNAFQDVATTTYVHISQHVTKNVWQIQTVWKRQVAARRDSALTKRFVWVAGRSRASTAMSTRSARPNSTVLITNASKVSSPFSPETWLSWW